ncbi:MAG: hypothetical protein ACI83P_001387 [Janthinobacterium sp.]|jgi:hypothetical protein
MHIAAHGAAPCIIGYLLHRSARTFAGCSLACWFLAGRTLLAGRTEPVFAESDRFAGRAKALSRPICVWYPDCPY